MKPQVEGPEPAGPFTRFLCWLIVGHKLIPALVKGPKTGWTYYGHRCSLCGQEDIDG